MRRIVHLIHVMTICYLLAVTPEADAESMPARQRQCHLAAVTRVIDGDTYDMRIDLGFDIYALKRVRLLGVDTPELRRRAERARALAAKAYVESRVTGKIVRICATKRDSFGRWLADVYYLSGGLEVDLATDLLASGHARRYER